MKKSQWEKCPDCGYIYGPNHEAWCPKLHPEEWSWLLRVTAGPARKEILYEGTADNLQDLSRTFRIWIGQQEEWRQTDTGSFCLEVFHLFRQRPEHHSEYTASFAHGCELWGNERAQADVIQAWQQAGGRYRTYS